MWGQIIGAGISALGSILGSDDDEQETTTRVNYNQMAKDAEAAGFNPLTVLRNGGAAGHTTVTHPGLASGWGEAAQTIGNFMMSWDPMSQKRAELDYQIAQAQLDMIQRGGFHQGLDNGMRSIGGVPTWAGPLATVGGNVVPEPEKGTAENPIDMWVWYRDRAGRKVLGPNPEMGDPETMLVDPIADWLQRYYGPKNTPRKWGPTLVTGPGSPNFSGSPDDRDEKPAAGWFDWLPSVSW